jgi:hypothetical protein
MKKRRRRADARKPKRSVRLPLCNFLAPIELLTMQLYQQQYRKFNNRELVEIWLAGYRRNPKHLGATATKPPVVGEWPILFKALGDKRLEEIYYDGYCYGMT